MCNEMKEEKENIHAGDELRGSSTRDCRSDLEDGKYPRLTVTVTVTVTATATLDSNGGVDILG